MIKVNGFNNSYLTLYKSGEIENGTPVSLSADFTVSPASESAFCGVCVSTDDTYALVQMKGYVEVEYAEQVWLGNACLITDINGKVCHGSEGVPCLIVKIDTENKRCGIIL